MMDDGEGAEDATDEFKDLPKPPFERKRKAEEDCEVLQSADPVGDAERVRAIREERKRIADSLKDAGPEPPKQKPRAPSPWPAASGPGVEKAIKESSVGKIETVDAEQEGFFGETQIPEETRQYWDAMTLRELDPRKVQLGTEQEFDRMDQFNCAEIVKRNVAMMRIKNHGKRTLTVTWSHTDRGKEVRSRFCAREVKRMDPNMEGVYTPASGNSTSRVIDAIAVKKKQKGMIGDAPNACFHAEETEESYVEPPEEWLQRKRDNGRDDDVKWRRKKQLYGRRKASKAFNECMVKQLTKLGFKQDEAAPYFFTHDEKEIDIELHQDDWYATAPYASLDWSKHEIKKEVTRKVGEKLGYGSKYQHLKGGRYRTERGMFLTGNCKYDEEIISCLGLEKCNPRETPIVNAITVKDEETEVEIHTLRGCASVPGEVSRRYDVCGSTVVEEASETK